MEPAFIVRFYRYTQERFPLKNFIPLSALFAASASIGVQTYLYGTATNLAGLVLPFFALLFFFFRLRIFDEFKDFKHDMQYYPARPLPRGLIHFRELRRVLYVVVVLEIIIAASRGISSLIPFIIAFIYSLLMRKEFFVSDWLRRHFTLYVISHEILILPLFFYIFSLNGVGTHHLHYAYFWFLTAFLGIQLFFLEVTRKIRAKESETASADTYTAQYGIKGASFLAASLSILSMLFGMITMGILQKKLSFFDYAPLLMFVLFFYWVWRFATYPSEICAKKVFNLSIVFVFIMNFAFLIHILGGNGKIYF